MTPMTKIVVIVSLLLLDPSCYAGSDHLLRKNRSMATYEEIEASTKGFHIGVDEVGNGALAGPVVVGAVRAPKDWNLEGLNDSKKLKNSSEKKLYAIRDKLLALVEQNVISYHLVDRSNTYLDKHGVKPTLNDAYVESFHKLYQSDSLIIMDGIFNFDNLGVDAYDKVWLIKADSKIPTVMAASVLAKTYRDEKMKQFHLLHPQYGWDSNVGYSSKVHLAALESFGPCHLHRFSYAPMKDMDLRSHNQLALDFTDGQ